MIPSEPLSWVLTQLQRLCRLQSAGVAHLVERHLANVEVARSRLFTRSNFSVPWPSGKAKVCKTFIPRFKSGRYLQH